MVKPAFYAIASLGLQFELVVSSFLVSEISWQPALIAASLVNRTYLRQMLFQCLQKSTTSLKPHKICVCMQKW